MNGRTQQRRNRSRTGRRKKRKEKKEEEDSLYAPISTTGILGLIIQMWMLLLENTRSRVDALSPKKQKIATTTQKRKNNPKHTDRCELRGRGTDIVWFLIKCPGRSGGGVGWGVRGKGLILFSQKGF